MGRAPVLSGTLDGYGTSLTDHSPRSDEARVGARAGLVDDERGAPAGERGGQRRRLASALADQAAGGGARAHERPCAVGHAPFSTLQLDRTINLIVAGRELYVVVELVRNGKPVVSLVEFGQMDKPILAE